ncbi:MAG: hypothetical protein FJ319_08195 [SAR202 cluster bacterium]|nr:hypothetical protein [SAR202 cluster bacterium]
MNTYGDVRFREEQKFRQPWLWLLMSMSVLPVVLVFGIGLVMQLGFDRPFGSKPMSDAGLVISAIACFAICGALTAGFLFIGLVTEVTDEAVLIKFSPLLQKTLPLNEIASCEASDYSPLKDFGGWGVRYGFSKGWAYNVSGSSGVQIVTSAGKKVLIGSRRAGELAEAINAACRRP